MKATLNLLWAVFAISYASAQTVPVGTPLVEDYWRRLQIAGENDINVSFAIRPLHGNALTYDSLYRPLHDSLHSFRYRKALVDSGNKTVRILPVTITQQYNTSQPYNWNDGPMIHARGYQAYMKFGVYGRLGPLSVQLQPEFVYAQNENFKTFWNGHSDSTWRSYSYVMNRIDAPEKLARGHYAKFFPGQSSIRLNLKKLSIGLSSENLWWGPGLRNSLMMSNNAPGFPHLTFNTTAPVLTKIGSFEWQIVAAKLKSSGELPFDTSKTYDGRPVYVPKFEDDRYMNGMIITWHPKWTNGLHLGFQRVFYQYNSLVPSSLDGYLPVFGSFFKKNARDENQYGRDQMLSVFLRMILPQSKAEFYVEYGRNDHSQDLIDLFLEPEHARAYIVGARKIFDVTPAKEIEAYMEVTHLQNPATVNLRALEGWYTHYQVKHGYTHRGQVVGAGIGPGGNSQIAGLNWIKGYRKTGLAFERIVHNNDFYYDAFKSKMDFNSHWVDLTMSINKQWLHNRFIYLANITVIRALNYQWQRGYDRSNLFMQFSVSYLF